MQGCYIQKYLIQIVSVSKNWTYKTRSCCESVHYRRVQSVSTFKGARLSCLGEICRQGVLLAAAGEARVDLELSV